MRLIGKQTAEIEFIKVHDKIIDYASSILMKHSKSEFTLMVGDKCHYTRLWLTIPKYPKEKNSNNVYKYVFDSEKMRYGCLKELSESFLELSTSRVFKKTTDKRNKPYILYVNDFWFLY